MGSAFHDGDGTGTRGGEMLLWSNTFAMPDFVDPGNECA